MTDSQDNSPGTRAKPRYLWPWFVLAAVLLAILLAVLWMSKEVERTRRLRDWNPPAPQTNQSTPALPSR